MFGASVSELCLLTKSLRSSRSMCDYVVSHQLCVSQERLHGFECNLHQIDRY